MCVAANFPAIPRSYVPLFRTESPVRHQPIIQVIDIISYAHIHWGRIPFLWSSKCRPEHYHSKHKAYVRDLGNISLQNRNWLDGNESAFSLSFRYSKSWISCRRSDPLTSETHVNGSHNSLSRAPVVTAVNIIAVDIGECFCYQETINFTIFNLYTYVCSCAFLFWKTYYLAGITSIWLYRIILAVVSFIVQFLCMPYRRLSYRPLCPQLNIKAVPLSLIDA